jgi:signal transduction histidine kinase/serine/threonine protein kinase/ligand-binding sensor domain-containing protein/CheY-like chemotaxis protein
MTGGWRASGAPTPGPDGREHLRFAGISALGALLAALPAAWPHRAAAAPTQPFGATAVAEQRSQNALTELKRRVRMLENRLLQARRPPRPFQWRTHGLENGLGSSEIYQLLETPDGTIWAGGIRGLHRFDGFEWRAVPGVGSRCHGLVYEPATGILWAGFEGGLYRLLPEADALEKVELPGVQAPVRTPSPSLDHEGRLWVSAGDGLLLRGEDGRWNAQPTPAVGSLAYATGVFPAASGRLLLGAESGLFERGADGSWGLVDGGPTARVLDLAEGAGALYVGTAAGLYIRDPAGRWSHISEAEGLPAQYCSALWYDAGRLWIGTWSGLCVLDSGELTCFGRRDGLSAGQVREVRVDRRGLVWVGTRGGGISVLNRELWSHFSEELGLLEDQVVYSRHLDTDGTLWVEAGHNGIVSLRADGRSARLPTPGVARAVTRDGLGRLWVGLQDTNPAYLENGVWQHVPGREARGTYFLLPGPAAREMWMGTYWNGLFRYADGVLTHWATERLGHSFVRMLYRARDGTLYVCTLNGDLWRLRPGGDELERWPMAERLPSTHVQAMTEASDGALWIGTGAGAVRLKGGELTRYTTAEGLSDNDVRAIAEDGAGRLWLGTADGMNIFDGQVWLTLGPADGVPGQLVTTVTAAPSGDVWMTGSAGVSRVRPAALTELRTLVELPRAVLEADGVLRAADLRPQVSAQTRWWSHPARLFRYSYRLDGGEWSPFMRADDLQLEDLADGQHRLEVRAKGPLLAIASRPAVVRFEVRRPAPREYYYLGALALALILAAALRERWRKRGRYVGPYRLMRMLGTGGMGQVWKARDLTGGGTVALKVLHPELTASSAVLERFRREGGPALRVEHPNVTRVLDRGEHGGKAYLAMELLDGWTLSTERRRRGGRFQLRDALDFGVVLLDALEALHGQRILHLDLKPENVLILRHGASWRERVRLLDFGLAELMSAQAGNAPPAVGGSIAYMAPEQALGRPLDVRADIFSAAVILYELMCGQPPFRGQHDLAVLQKMIGGQPPELSGLLPGAPASLERVLQRALAQEARQRYPDVASFRMALEAVAAEVEGRELPEPPGHAAESGEIDTPLRESFWTSSLLAGSATGLRRRLSLVYELIEALLHPELDELLERLMDRVVELLGAERACIFLKDPAGNIELRVSRGEAGPRGSALVQRVLDSGVPAYIVDRDESGPGEGTGESILCVPFVHGGQILGALYLDSSRKLGASFSLDDGHLLASLAALAATAIANRREMHRRLRLEEQLQQAQKMETVGTLAGGIAHDFNNLLAGMIGTLSMLDWQLAADEEPSLADVREELEVVRDCALRAAEIVQQLLSLSRRGELHLGSVDLGQLVGDVVKMSKASFDPRVEMRIEPMDGPVLAVADPVRIKQVLLNLTLNARDALQDAGQIVYELERFEAERCAEVDPQAPEQAFVRIGVRDNGTGIDPEVLPRIFDPFFTTKPQGKGTGLGLAMVYGIVAQHHGYLKVESAPGKGSAFHVFLPASDRQPSGSPFPPSELPRGTETVLVIDDEQVVRQLARGMLGMLGYEAICAADGEEALSVLGTREGVDLVLLDLIMPRLSGRETLMRIRKLRPELPILVSSGVQLDPLAHGIRGLRISGLLAKPYELIDLAIAVRLALDSWPNSHPSRSEAP